MHRSTLSWLAIAVMAAVVSTACTSGSTAGKSTSLASAEPTAGSASGPRSSGAPVASVDVAADVFTCPSSAEINSLTAMVFVAAVGNGVDHCEYTVPTGSTQAVRVTIDHPPASATSAQQTLPQFRAAVAAAGNVVLKTAPQYSADSFIARFGTLSCSVFALARDGRVMQVQASHQTPVPLDDCSLAQSVTAVAGTVSGAGPAVPGSGAAPSSVAPASSGPSTSSAAVGTTSVAPTPTPTRTATTTAPTTRRPSTPTSPSEVLIFSTGPAASITLPIAPTSRTR